MGYLEYKIDQVTDLKKLFYENMRRREFVVSLVRYDSKEKAILFIGCFTKDRKLRSWVAGYLRCYNRDIVYQTYLEPIYIQNTKDSDPYMEIEMDGQNCHSCSVAYGEFLSFSGALSIPDEEENYDIESYIYISTNEGDVGNIGGPLETDIARTFAEKHRLPVQRKKYEEPTIFSYDGR